MKKKKKNLESSTTSINSNSKEVVKNENLSNTIKKVNKLNLIDIKGKSNSPEHENKLLKKPEFQSLSNSKEKKRYNIYGIISVYKELYKICCSNDFIKSKDLSVSHKRNKEKFYSNKIKSPINYKLSKTNISHQEKCEFSFNKDKISLQEKIILLEQKVSTYKQEKDSLRKQLNEISNDENFKKIEKLENEIKKYQNTSNVYLKNCSQLAEQIIVLRRELEKFMINSVKLSKTIENDK